MRRFLVFAAAVLILCGGLIGGSTAAQDDDLEATLETLQTQVAEVETAIAERDAGESPTEEARSAPELDEAVPVGAGVELLYYDVLLDEDGDPAIFGEYRNASGETIWSPYLRFVLLDADGNIIETIDARPLFPEMAPGDVVPFSATYLGVSRDEWAREEVMACEGVGDFNAEVSSNLELRSVEEIEKVPGRLRVEGVVANTGSAPAPDVAIKAVIRSMDGRVAGTAATSVDVSIPAGKTARFELFGYGSDMAGVSTTDDYTYDLWVGSTSGVAVYGCPG